MLRGHQGICLVDPSAAAPGLRDGSLTSRSQGKVYDVTGNKAYQPGGSYHGVCHGSFYVVPSAHGL